MAIWDLPACLRCNSMIIVARLLHSQPQTVIRYGNFSVAYKITEAGLFLHFEIVWTGLHIHRINKPSRTRQMEVASPLSFVPNSASAKRHLPCSPSFVDTSLNPFDSSDDFMQHRSFKRRRFNMDVSMEGDSENSVNHVSLPVHHNQQQKTVFGTPYGTFLL